MKRRFRTDSYEGVANCWDYVEIEDYDLIYTMDGVVFVVLNEENNALEIELTNQN